MADGVPMGLFLTPLPHIHISSLPFCSGPAACSPARRARAMGGGPHRRPCGVRWGLADRRRPAVPPLRFPSASSLVWLGHGAKAAEEGGTKSRGGRKEREIEMKRCELCERAARMYCESDQASLCWECDAKVHAANFLVARHSRTLLCRTCQSPTPWQAAGARLGPTISICDRCSRLLAGRKQPPEIRGDEVGGGQEEEGEGGGGYGELAEEEEEEEEEEEIEDEEEELEEETEEEDGENQVVPWSPPPLLQPPPAASSSTSEESSSRSGNGFLKRMRENATDLASQEDFTFSSSPSNVAVALPHARSPWSPVRAAADDEATSYRPSKERRKSVHLRSAPAPAQPGGSPGKDQHGGARPTTDASAADVLEIRDCGDHRAVDLVSPASRGPPI